MKLIDKVFIAIPSYREWSCDYETWIPPGKTAPETKKLTAMRKFLIDCVGYSSGGYKPWLETHPEDRLFFQDGGTTGINTTFATSSMAQHFLDEDIFDAFDWFLWWSSDQTMNPSDVRLLIDCAVRYKLPVIGGLVTLRKKPAVLLAGTFDPKHPNEVRYFRRGVEVTDADVLAKRTKRLEIIGGGGLIHRSVLEKFRPELNNGLAYFCYDKQSPSYDWRFFQRLKEKGIPVGLQCGVIIHHWGLDEKGEEHGYNYYESPAYNLNSPERFDNKEDWPETLKPEVGAAV